MPLFSVAVPVAYEPKGITLSGRSASIIRCQLRDLFVINIAAGEILSVHPVYNGKACASMVAVPEGFPSPAPEERDSGAAPAPAEGVQNGVRGPYGAPNEWLYSVSCLLSPVSCLLS
jgi:hypothetical protein